MKTFLTCLIALGLFGCKTPCQDPGSVASFVSGAIVAQWQCQNAAQVQSDVAAKVAGLNLCSDSMQVKGAIGNLACPLLVQGLMQIADSKVPASWQCNPAKVGANAEAALMGLCTLLPF